MSLNQSVTAIDVRINTQRLLRSIISSLLLPVTVAVLIDLQVGWFPLLTIGATIIFIPLSTVIVIRAALSEMDQVIQKVAPLDLESNVADSENL